MQIQYYTVCVWNIWMYLHILSIWKWILMLDIWMRKWLPTTSMARTASGYGGGCPVSSSPWNSGKVPRTNVKVERRTTPRLDQANIYEYITCVFISLHQKVWTPEAQLEENRENQHFLPTIHKFACFIMNYYGRLTISFTKYLNNIFGVLFKKSWFCCPNISGNQRRHPLWSGKANLL